MTHFCDDSIFAMTACVGNLTIKWKFLPWTH